MNSQDNPHEPTPEKYNQASSSHVEKHYDPTQAKTAKQLTFTYFSIVAFAIITFHFALFDMILDDIERLTAQNRMKQDTLIAEQQLNAMAEQNKPLTGFSIPPFSHVYLDRTAIPIPLDPATTLARDTAFVVEPHLLSDESYEYFVMRSQVSIQGQKQTIYLVHFDAVYERSEEEAFQTQTKQLLLSFGLLCLSLWVVLRISARLTSPLSQLSQTLARRSPQDLAPIPPPEGVATQEVLRLVDQLNQYQSRIHQLLERERAFNRYASHELRTPLMVIKGAVSLLGQSDNPEFIEKQRQRLKLASNEMNDFVSTLLSLTREEDISQLKDRCLEQAEIEAIAFSHQSLLADKPVRLVIEQQNTLCVRIPETSLKILLGNLIKNAFACTEQGQVIIQSHSSGIDIIDSGVGLGSKPRGVEGFGLGLLIAHDICRKYGWELTLKNNDQGGCTASVKVLKRS